MTDSQPLSHTPGVIVVADDPAASVAAARAVGQAGGRLLATLTWQVALARLDLQATPPILLIEAAGVPEATVAALLPGLVAAVGAEQAIVAFDTALVDVVGAALLGTGASLLCDPDVVDRTAQLALAMTASILALHDSSGEAARLARINQEVARFTETLARLTGAAPDLGALPATPPLVGDRHLGFGQPAGTGRLATPGEIRKAIRARRLRDEAFGQAGLFEDPAWDMLLDLYAAKLEQRPVSVSSLCIAAAVAPTTALRWINKLIEVGLFERRPDEIDRRRAFVALTERASAAMRDYILALGRAGLSLA